MLVFVYAQIAHKKNFASCRLREKNFASLRLRKNLVELRARLSLLVDKTTFLYSVLTIHYTTIDGPPAAASTRSHGGWGRPGRARISPTRHANQGREKEGGTNAPGSPPPAPAAVMEGPPWARRITTSGRSRGRMGRARISTPPPPPPWRKGRGGTLCRIIPAPARRGGRDALDAPDHHHQSQPWGGGCDAMDALDHPPAPARRAGWGRPGRDGITITSARRGGRDAMDAPGSPQRSHAMKKNRWHMPTCFCLF